MLAWRRFSQAFDPINNLVSSADTRSIRTVVARTNTNIDRGRWPMVSPSQTARPLDRSTLRL